MGFSTPSYGLHDLFARIDRGDLQLPDFQRGYKWNLDAIRELIVTVLRGYPVGALMALETRHVPIRFRPRPIDGAPDLNDNPGLLLLDGQQRLTSLYHTLKGEGFVKTVDSRSKPIKRRFFVDLNKVAESDILPDEAVFSVDKNGKVRSHFGPQIDFPLDNYEAYLKANVVPVSTLLSDKVTDLLLDMASTGNMQRQEVKAFNNKVVKPLAGYQIPVIRLDRETAQAGVGSIFAHANSAGLQMDVFELLTAVFAAEDPEFDLKADWDRTRVILGNHPVFMELDRTDFLTAVALYVTAKKGHARGHREDILRLTLDDYIPAAESVRKGIKSAAEFVTVRGMFTAEQIPFPKQLIPITVILALLADTPEVFESQDAVDRMNRWFWSGVFGELYSSHSLTTRIAHDCSEVTRWVRAGADGDDSVPEPATVQSATFNESRLFSVGRDSPVHKAIYTLLMARGARDWRTGELFTEQSCVEMKTGFHTIFPGSWCEDNGVDRVLEESVLNLTPMARRTEVVRAGTSPARYLARLMGKSLMDQQEFNKVLASHLLDPELLQAGEPFKFFADRRERFVKMVEEAMGKPVIHDVNEDDLRGGFEGPDAFLN